MAVTTRLRSWGISRRDISTSIIVTGVWNVLARLALPVVGILIMLTQAGHQPARPQCRPHRRHGRHSRPRRVHRRPRLSERAAQVAGRILDRIAAPIRRWRPDGRLGAPVWLRRSRPPAAAGVAGHRPRTRTINVVRAGWLQMTFGMVGFFAMFCLLFWFCPNTVGVQFPFLHMFFASPSLGCSPPWPSRRAGWVTETATALLMVGWGADPAQATAGVVLFSLFTNFLEVPLGEAGSARRTPRLTDHPVRRGAWWPG